MAKKHYFKDKTLEQIKELAKKIMGATSVVIFTGAGISTESGIPDYRSQGGLWDRFQPIYFDEFMRSKTARIQYWDQRLHMEKSLKHACPNQGHKAIAELENLGYLTCVITQNIDGLHQNSGIPENKIIELHGNTRRVRCMSCEDLISWEQAMELINKGNKAPECICGGYYKPDTISFGQAMPRDETREAERLSSGCDLFIAVGSTLLVQPAALMPKYAKSSGAFLTILNLSDTPYDNECDLLIREKAGPVLSTVVAIVTELKKTGTRI